MSLNKLFLLSFSVLIILSSKVVATEDFLIKGNEYYQSYLEKQDSKDLENAYSNYYKEAQVRPSVSSFVGMGKVLIEQNNYPEAKKYLYRAYSIDKNDAITNYYLAKFSFNNQEYLRALSFFLKAYQNGLANNFDVNVQIATIYEKVGDFELAKKYYISAQNLSKENDYFGNKIFNLDDMEANKIKYFNDWD